MNPKADLQIALKYWGPAETPFDRKSVELWGSIHPDLVIETYKALAKGSITAVTQVPTPTKMGHRS